MTGIKEINPEDEKLEYANRVVATFFREDRNIAMTKVKINDVVVVAVVKMNETTVSPLALIIDKELQYHITAEDGSSLISVS